MANNSGYSGTPLIKKLGIKPEMKVMLLNVPGNYSELLEADIAGQIITGKQLPDLIHLFVKNKTVFEKAMPEVLAFAKKNSAVIIWVSWYKKASGIATDITEDVIRDYALKNDLVDVKVCAVSELWSGLKLVVPVARR
jgi:hypothetical protein